MPNNEQPKEVKKETIIDDLNKGIIDSEGTQLEGNDYKANAIKTYKNSIAHYDVLIAQLKGQVSNPEISDSLRADYEKQIKDAEQVRSEVKLSLSILEKEDDE